jgi:Holliday junction resolvase RusA-like endonuclease
MQFLLPLLFASVFCFCGLSWKIKSCNRFLFRRSVAESAANYVSLALSETEYDVSFEVLGEPQPLGRHRMAGKHMYNPSSKLQKEFLKSCKSLLPQSPLTGPLEASIMFYFKRPQNHFRSRKFTHEKKAGAPKWHFQRKDLDNCVKFVLDALNGVAYEDDSQIASINCSKLYSDTFPSTIVRIKRIS